MLLISVLTLHIDRWLKQSARCAAFAFCALLGLSLFLFFYRGGSSSRLAEVPMAMQKEGRLSFSYEAIGSGALALKPRHPFGWVSRLADEVVLVAYNNRPDVDPSKASILLSLKCGKQQVALGNGMTAHLKESDQGRGLYLSEAPTGLWIKPLLLENGAVLIEAGRRLTSKEGLVGEEKGQFVLAQTLAKGALRDLGQHPFAAEIKSARYFVQDLLMQKYGGQEYADFKGKAVLELTQAEGSYACFVGTGDYLQYEGGQWKIKGVDSLLPNCPIARVKSILPKAIEMEVWDETGFYPLCFKVPSYQAPRLQLKNEVMPSSLRLRTASQVSCALGKRRVVLRQGDWLLKTQNGWRNLRKKEEIEHYLSHRLKGELIVFDGIEQEQGRPMMKGHLFDETRTQILPFALAVESDKMEKKPPRKRKTVHTPYQGRVT